MSCGDCNICEFLLMTRWAGLAWQILEISASRSGFSALSPAASPQYFYVRHLGLDRFRREKAHISEIIGDIRISTKFTGNSVCAG